MRPARPIWAPFAWALALGMPAMAGAADLHALWDRQCGGCHGHAAQFARDSLTLEDGELRGRESGRAVASFLATHNGGYAPEVIAGMVDMLKAQASCTDLFRRKCGGCHETAAQLVREQIVERDGDLVGIVSKRRMSELLPDHADLTAEETETLLRVLRRIEGEVRYRP